MGRVAFGIAVALLAAACSDSTGPEPPRVTRGSHARGEGHPPRSRRSAPGISLEEGEILVSSDPFVEGDSVMLEWGDVPGTD